MANEKRLIDANALKLEAWPERCTGEGIVYVEDIDNAPTVDAVEVEKYNALIEMYHNLRENFVDYVCSGTLNVAPYCLNKCNECVDGYGWCKHNDKCQGFNPAEVILMDGDGNG